MKVKLTLDRQASSSKKNDALSKVMRAMGSNVTISGDVIVVADGNDERKVVDVLNRENVGYARST
jgi:uncharacterized protein with von Willebrand factor type A (vWA) domain